MDALINRILTDDFHERNLASDRIIDIVRSWSESFSEEEEIPSQSRNGDSNHVADGDNSAVHDANSKYLFEQNILFLLLLKINCPFEDVREKFRIFLDELGESGIRIPKVAHESPSYFITEKQLPPLSSDNQLMVNCFLTNGRLSHVYRIMSYFPNYMENFMKTFNHILKNQAPLPKHIRNYIAIMASSQHSCQYLISLQTREFIINGGDQVWLKGIKFAPQKIQNLTTLNTLMAHQPWRITEKHISALLKGDDNWSKSELVLAIVIIAKFHSLCSVVLGCGIVPEPDMEGGYCEGEIVHEASMGNDSVEDLDELAQDTARLIQRLQRRDSVQNPEIPKEKLFETLETQETFSGHDNDRLTHTSKEPDSRQVKKARIEDKFSKYLGQEEVRHVDFDVKSTEYYVFRLQDYNWEEQGCSLVSKFLPEVGEMLDVEFNSILNLTDYSLFNSKEELETDKVDTWPFRQAVWYYVLRLAGMSHDDYNYHEVNIYLNKRIKQYIKKVACYPEAIQANDFHHVGFNFRNDEKCHINILAAEARKCAELLYALHALMDQ